MFIYKNIYVNIFHLLGYNFSQNLVVCYLNLKKQRTVVLEISTYVVPYDNNRPTMHKLQVLTTIKVL